MAPNKTAKKSAKKTSSGKSRAGKKKPSARRRAKKYVAPPSKYVLYENSVQSPDWHVEHFPRFHQWITKKKPLNLREDFCGTARISCEWVKQSPYHRATGLDLDIDTLKYAKQTNVDALPPDARNRVRLERQNVLVPTKEQFDLIAACNFSFFIFKERQALLQYAHSVLQSLKKDGTFFLEMAGGEGMMEEEWEARYFKVPDYGRVQYVWQQHQYDPIQAVSDYSIHFKLPNGRWIKDAFTYHWRLWGIRETREILLEAGFRDTFVFWEPIGKDGDGTGEFLPLENGDHAHAWITYVVGVK